MRGRIVPLLLAGLMLLGAGCGGRKALTTSPEAASAPTELSGSLRACERGNKHARAAQVTGTTRSGALYALYRPADWNGDLVLYAHGYTPPGAPIALPTSDFAQEFRDLLLARGYAFAYSSFSENGLAIADGIRQTEILQPLFTMRLGRPRRTFLVGPSMGGLIVLAMAEQHPGRYAGAMPISGILGGTQGEIDYIANVRILFDVFYAGVLPGSLLSLPADLDIDNDIIGPAVAAMQANPSGAFAISQLVQTPVPFADGPELVQSIVTALVYHATELGDLLRRTGGQSFFDNSGTAYDGALDPSVLAYINATVPRFTSSHRVKAFFRALYEPTGRLEIPVLSMHTERDPVVPLFNELEYGDRVAAAGRSSLLEQRFENRYGHVGYPADQMILAFEDLVSWADSRRLAHEGHDIRDWQAERPDREGSPAIAGFAAR